MKIKAKEEWAYIKILAILLPLSLVFASCFLARQHYGLSDEDYDYIKRETLGGELDFENRLEKDKVYLYNGAEFSRREWGLLMWGKAVKSLGVKNRLDAVMLYEEISGSELSPEESKAIKTGFDSK